MLWTCKKHFFRSWIRRIKGLMMYLTMRLCSLESHHKHHHHHKMFHNFFCIESVRAMKKTNIESLMVVRHKWKWLLVRKSFVEYSAVFCLYVPWCEVDRGGESYFMSLYHLWNNDFFNTKVGQYGKEMVGSGECQQFHGKSIPGRKNAGFLRRLPTHFLFLPVRNSLKPQR